MSTVPELLAIDFQAQFRFPMPAAWASRRISVADTDLERRQAIAWAAEMIGRLAGSVVQADRHAAGIAGAVPADAQALRWSPHPDPFLRELELPWAGARGLCRLADETDIDDPVATLLRRIRHLARALEFLASYRLIVLEETRRGVTPAWVFLGPGPALPMWLRGLPAEGGPPAGVPVLIDPRDGRYLTLEPYLRYVAGVRRLDLFIGTEGNEARFMAADGSNAYLMPLPAITPCRGQVELPPAVAHQLADPTAELDDGALFADEFRILGWMARGGVAEIYLARQRESGQLAVIKLFVPDEDNRFDRNLLRFIDEGRFRERVEGDHVVQMYRTGAVGNHRFMEMEYLPGGDLGEQLARTGPLPPSRAVDIALEMTHALEAIHAADIVHRDLKPGNVMFTWEREGRLIDLGIARTMDPPESKAGSTGRLGTEGYMAPEQVRGRRVDRRTDVYGIGVLLHEMITGVRPDQVTARADHPQVPRGLVPVIARCLAFRPEQRYPDMAALREAILGWRASRQGKEDAFAITLDLEGTLINNATEADPRPGLSAFLDWCHQRFDRIFIYTAVEGRIASEILRRLVYEGVVGADVAERMEYVRWSRGFDGARKDLRRCAFPVERNVILDDMKLWIMPDQRHRWVEAPDYNEPDPTDRFLSVAPRRIERVIEASIRPREGAAAGR